VDINQLTAWYRKYRPDVIISSGTDGEVWDALKKSDLQIPEEVGFVTLSRNDESIAGINENEHRVGVVAVDQLAQLLYYNQKGIPEYPHVLIIPPSWEDGPTCVKKSATALS
jgi:LacI family transcriptional regulator